MHGTRSTALPASLLTCSCSDFDEEYRGDYRLDDPRRLCRHLVERVQGTSGVAEYFTEYREELIALSKTRKGFHPYIHKESTIIDEKRLTVFADDYDETSLIYTTTVFFEGKRYTYEPETGKWGDGSPPQWRDEIQFMGKGYAAEIPAPPPARRLHQDHLP